MKSVVKRARHPLRFLKALSPSSKTSKPKVRRGETQASLSKFVETDRSWTESEGTVVDAGHQFSGVKDMDDEGAQLHKHELDRDNRAEGRPSLEGHVWITVTKEVDMMEESQDALLADNTGAGRGEDKNENLNVLVEPEVDGESPSKEQGHGLSPGLVAEDADFGSMGPEVAMVRHESPPCSSSTPSPSNDLTTAASSPHVNQTSPDNSQADLTMSEPLQNDSKAFEDSTLSSEVAEESEQPVETIDPFLVDDPDDPDSDDVQTPRPTDALHSRNSSLLASIPTDFPATPYTPNPDSQFPSEPANTISANTASTHVAVMIREENPTPHLPGADPDSDDDEPAPEFHLPSLTMPTMFLPIPNVRLYEVPSLFSWWYSASKALVSYSYARIFRPTR